MYRASAEVLLPTQNVVTALNGVNDPTVYQSPDRRAQTQADLARVPAVARDALRRAGLKRSVTDFLNHSSATAKTNADLLELSAEDHRPELARRLATAYAEAFSAYRAQLDIAPYANARRQANAELKALAGAHNVGSPAYQALVSKRAQLDTTMALLTKWLKSLKSNAASLSCISSESPFMKRSLFFSSVETSSGTYCAR